MSYVEPTIAVVGSGPAGCYAAQFLRKKWPDADITIFEALPVPYGLVRYGVAPDHQGTKGVAAQFDRLFERERVRFAGNVMVGRDLSVSALYDAFDIVIVATGLPHDRRPKIEGLSDTAWRGAGMLLRGLNGYPDIEWPRSADGSFRALGRRVALVGNGNVAMDVLRLLSKTSGNLLNSDIDDMRHAALQGEGIRSISVFGRSPLSRAKCDLSMFREVIMLPNVTVTASGLDADAPCPARLLLDEKRQSGEKAEGKLRIDFHFSAEPVSARAKGTSFSLAVRHGPEADVRAHSFDTLISAIGFEGLADDLFTTRDDPERSSRTFHTGWVKRGGIGTVAENRRDAKDVAAEIVKAVESQRFTTGRAGYPELAEQLFPNVVDFHGWKKIDAHELATSMTGRCRRKLTNIAAMLDIAGLSQQSGMTQAL